MTERSVEGRHSLVHRIRKRCPAASVGFISSELRFPLLQQLSATDPEAKCLWGPTYTMNAFDFYFGSVPVPALTISVYGFTGFVGHDS